MEDNSGNNTQPSNNQPQINNIPNSQQVLMLHPSPKPKTLIIIGSAILFTILTGITVYIAVGYFRQDTNEINQLVIVPKTQPTTIENPSSSPSGYTKQFLSLPRSDSVQMIKGGLGAENKGYQLMVQPGWSVVQKQHLYSDESIITLDAYKNYVLRIAQGGFSGFRCIYPGGTVQENTNDQLFQDYVELIDQGKHHYRRALRDDDIPEGLEGTKTYYVCEYNPTDGNYYFPTKSYEYITYTVSDSPEYRFLKDMDQMIASIKNTSENK